MSEPQAEASFTAEVSRNPEGVSRHDDLPLFFHPGFEQVFEGRGDEPLDRSGPPAAPEVARDPAPRAPFGNPEPQPEVAQVEAPAPAPAAAAPQPSPLPAADPADPMASVLALVAQQTALISSQQSALNTLLESTQRSFGALNSHLAAAAPPPPPPPVDPRVEVMAERLGMDARELQSTLVDLAAVAASTEVQSFASALNENIGAVSARERAVEAALKAEDPAFDLSIFKSFVSANTPMRVVYETSQDPVAAARLVWGQVRASAPSPTEPAQVVAPAPVAGARAATTPARGGARPADLTEDERQAAELERLRKRAEGRSDNHPASAAFFMQRIFGGHTAKDFEDVRRVRHGSVPRRRTS